MMECTVAAKFPFPDRLWGPQEADPLHAEDKRQMVRELDARMVLVLLLASRKTGVCQCGVR